MGFVAVSEQDMGNVESVLFYPFDEFNIDMARIDEYGIPSVFGSHEVGVGEFTE